MQGAGPSIGKALRRWGRDVLLFVAEDPPMNREDADWCMWARKDYPAVLKALMKLREFKDDLDESKADAYICGYYRGIREAVFLLNVRIDRQKPKRKRKRK